MSNFRVKTRLSCEKLSKVDWASLTCRASQGFCMGEREEFQSDLVVGSFRKAERVEQLFVHLLCGQTCMKVSKFNSSFLIARTMLENFKSFRRFPALLVEGKLGGGNQGSHESFVSGERSSRKSQVCRIAVEILTQLLEKRRQLIKQLLEWNT